MNALDFIQSRYMSVRGNIFIPIDIQDKMINKLESNFHMKPKKLNIKSISIDYKGDGNYTELKEGEYEEIIFWNEVTNKFESNGFRIIPKNAKDKTNN